ncbi:ABC transporter permease [Actinomycetes bacterium KLBMP 9797]
MKAVLRVARAAVRRRRVQSLVIGTVVLLTSGTMVLGIGLLVASNGPFDRAFASQSGAHAAASFDAATVTGADLAATAQRPGVTAAAGPFDATQAQLLDGGRALPPGTLVGRAEADTAVDKLDVSDGRWLTGPGQIVLSGDLKAEGPGAPGVGDRLTVDVPGQPSLEIVGFADSITGTANAWVSPEQTDVLRAQGVPVSRQMLYRFASAGTEEAVTASLDTATAALKDGALTGSTSYLAAKLRLDSNIKVMVPFVVAFAVLGLAMSVLIVVNVVAGAVVAGFQVIGVQKTLGFTPAQVVGVYTGQILAVCVPACLVGVALGHLLALPVLAQAADGYGVAGAATVPPWVDALVLLALPAIVGLAAVATATRAGRLSAVQAITVGRAPRAGRGFRVRRALAATGLPRPVSFGLGTPFARPARAAVTVIAVLLGATTVVFATGLATSLTRVADGFNRISAIDIDVNLMRAIGPGGGQVAGPPRSGPAPDPATVRAAIDAQAGTARVVGMAQTDVGLAGSTDPLQVRAYDGDASWTGYPILAGRWYSGADEVVAGSRMLRLTGAKVGDYLTLTTDQGQRRVHLVGEVFSNAGEPMIIMSTAGLTGLVENVAPDHFEVALTDGTDPRAYAEALNTAFGGDAARASVTAEEQENEAVAIMIGLITLLTVLLSAVAALGVFNTVVLNTRERVHEIGVLKSIGMTPRQVRAMVVTSMAAVGLLGGALAVPLGYGLHRWVLPVMGEAAGTGLPDSVLAVYGPAELVALGAAGMALAVLGALVPAGWAARTRPATALRAE